MLAAYTVIDIPLLLFMIQSFLHILYLKGQDFEKTSLAENVFVSKSPDFFSSVFEKLFPLTFLQG